MEFLKTEKDTVIPTNIIEKIHINYSGKEELVSVPMATFEVPLWHSTKRGALVSQKTAGINVHVIDDIMTRSIVLESTNLEKILECKRWVEINREIIFDVVEKTSQFTKLKSIHTENVGRLLFIRLSMRTGNASGHNMTTKAADSIASLIIANCEDITYVSISGNYCTDKKNSSINGILGRGKRTSAEIVVPRSVCESVLKTTPKKIVDLNIKKNFIGSILAGGVRSANAHFANAVLAVYLATGQDAANIIEASQGITFAELYENSDLYFSVTIPNLIVGTVGNGKNLDFAKKNLEIMECNADDPLSSQRLSAIITAAVLCSELSLMSAQTNEGELMKSHVRLERTV